MAKAPRPFNPNVFAELGKAAIKAPIGVGAVVWRYTILVPMEETRPGGSPRSVATFEDFEKLQTLLIRHFDGVTILPNSVGYGLRGKRVELNKHVPFVVYAAATTASDLYFQTLRKELEEALLQETVLVERHEVWLH